MIKYLSVLAALLGATLAFETTPEQIEADWKQYNELLAQFESGELSWKPVHPNDNPIFGVPESQLYGAATEEVEHDEFFMKHLKRGSDLDAVADLPTSYSLIDDATKSPYISDCKNQGGCGSCWSFGTGGAVTDRWRIATQSTDIDLSQ